MNPLIKIILDKISEERVVRKLKSKKYSDLDSYLIGAVSTIKQLNDLYIDKELRAHVHQLANHYLVISKTTGWYDLNSRNRIISARILYKILIESFKEWKNNEPSR